LGAAVFTCGVMTTPDHVASPVGALCAPSFVCPSADAVVATSGAPPVGVVAVPAPLPLGMVPADP
jgi:hypothetical protein